MDYYHGSARGTDSSAGTQSVTPAAAVLSAGCHAFDALLLCMGDEVESVSSYSTGSANKDFKKYEYDTSSVTILKLRTAASARLRRSSTASSHTIFTRISLGARAACWTISFTRKTRRSKRSRQKQVERVVDETGRLGRCERSPVPDPVRGVFCHLGPKRERDAVDYFATAAKSHEIIFAADLSAKKNRPVKLSELRA
ncbi:MAG: hypothetical protein Ct9H300mP32_0970 [Verrucomicrobiota bacterium]|nr:MAG: hypothetical protein Ct9H300mP32_0970 [Verrucomicrobiota bacterium]